MRRLNVSLEGLIALVTVAQEGSLERGGKALGLSPSAAGKQISTLEKAVGAKTVRAQAWTVGIDRLNVESRPAMYD